MQRKVNLQGYSTSFLAYFYLILPKYKKYLILCQGKNGGQLQACLSFENIIFSVISHIAVFNTE